MSNKSIILKFQKLDKFKNHVFLASQTGDAEAHNALCEMSNKLESKFPEASGTPCYIGHGFASFRINKQTKFKFYENNEYTLIFKLKRTTATDGRVFINAVLVSSKLAKRGEDADSGEDVEI